MSTYFDPIKAGYKHIRNRTQAEPPLEQKNELLEFGLWTPLFPSRGLKLIHTL